MKTSFYIAAATALLVNHAKAGYTNVSEVPLYGLSPPVYPTRMLNIHKLGTVSKLT